jgi:MOSC domain-containing protein YiiM
MKLLSVNVAMPVPTELGDKTYTTAICKRPVDGAVMMRAGGLDGDAVGNLKHHGGPDQAVYACAAEHYDFWRRELGRDGLEHGLFGENLTVAGWLDEGVCIGDTYRVGGAAVRITGPRIPCDTLERRVGVRGFAKRYAKSRRFGLYLRVVEPGEVCAGDDVSLIQKSPAGLGLIELAELFLYRPKDTDAMRRALEVEGLGERCRAVFEERIAGGADTHPT